MIYGKRLVKAIVALSTVAAAANANLAFGGTADGNAGPEGNARFLNVYDTSDLQIDTAAQLASPSNYGAKNFRNLRSSPRN